uniref:Translin n=1 Tax=Marmota marmota marmota TaxID=9994 RepID=A0A8C6A2N0_MARMA
MSVSEIFVELQGFLAAEQDIREEIRKVVQSLEQTAREILTLLQGVHQGAGFQDIPKRCLKAREHFGTVKTHLTSLKTKFPAEQYYRFHEHWRFVLQRLVFLAAFVVYLETETLVTREAVTEILGIEPDREKGFHLDVEDYLSGVLILASELSRLSVNSVTAGDYSRPLHISTFINELDSGFRLLNLKNDSLRKRYDGLNHLLCLEFHIHLWQLCISMTECWPHCLDTPAGPASQTSSQVGKDSPSASSATSLPSDLPLTNPLLILII